MDWFRRFRRVKTKEPQQTQLNTFKTGSVVSLALSANGYFAFENVNHEPVKSEEAPNESERIELRSSDGVTKEDIEHGEHQTESEGASASASASARHMIEQNNEVQGACAGTTDSAIEVESEIDDISSSLESLAILDLSNASGPVLKELLWKPEYEGPVNHLRRKSLKRLKSKKANNSANSSISGSANSSAFSSRNSSFSLGSSRKSSLEYHREQLQSYQSALDTIGDMIKDSKKLKSDLAEIRSDLSKIQARKDKISAGTFRVKNDLINLVEPVLDLKQVAGCEGDDFYVEIIKKLKTNDDNDPIA